MSVENATEAACRAAIKEHGYEVGKLIGRGGFGYVFENLDHKVAIKVILNVDNDLNFYRRAENEFIEGRKMALLGVGVPVYEFMIGNRIPTYAIIDDRVEIIGSSEYAIIIMALGTPVTKHSTLDKSYFIAVFKKIARIDQTGNWCVDYKFLNTIIWKDEPFLIDFDQDFCEQTSEVAFWAEWKRVLAHYEIEKPDNLFNACDIDPNNLEHVRDEFRGPGLEMFLAQCYIFFQFASLHAHYVSGYITALHEIIYVRHTSQRVRPTPEAKTGRRRTPTRRRRPPRRPRGKNKSKTWADTWQETVHAVMSYLTGPTGRRQHIRSRRRK